MMGKRYWALPWHGYEWRYYETNTLSMCWEVSWPLDKPYSHREKCRKERPPADVWAVYCAVTALDEEVGWVEHR